MKHERIWPRNGLVAVCIVALSATAACEDDGLVPTQRTDPPTCQEDPRYCDGVGLLDGGTPPTLDSGFTDSGPTDTGIADAGIVDTGPADTGVPPPPTWVDLNISSMDTFYRFDWSDALFGLNNIGSLLISLDATINGNFSGVLEDEVGLPGFLADTVAAIAQPIIDDAVANSLPQWFPDLISIMADASQFFEDVEVTSALYDIQSDPPPMAPMMTRGMRASESWDEVILHLRSRCPAGYTPTDIANTGCDLFPVNAAPATPPFPNDPCDPMPDPTIAVIPQNPFTGVQDMGYPTATFQMNNRDVEIDVQGLVLIALDEVTKQVTNGQYETFRCAVVNAVPCGDIAAAIAGQTGAVGQIALEQACFSVVDNAVLEMLTQAQGVGVGFDAFRNFDQIGLATDLDGVPDPQGFYTAEQLQIIASPSPTIDGGTVGGDLEGRWCAPRTVNTTATPHPAAAACGN